MANSIEVRSPFLDYRFIQFSQKIPSNLKVNFKDSKILMREIIRDLVPKEIISRNKMGFTPPIKKWLYNLLDEKLFQKYVSYLEPFNNDLPNENVKLTEDNNQYSEDSLPLMALDQSVIQQHNKYVTERNKVTSTASFQPSRSDTQDVVPFVGLRRPSYSVNGKDLVDETARTVPTELDADQLAKPTQIYWK